MFFSHSRVCETAVGKLTRIDADWGNASSRVTPARGGLPAKTEVKALSRKEMGLRAREVWRKES